MKSIPKGAKAKAKPKTTSFRARRGHLLQLAKKLEPNVSQKETLSFRTGGRDLVGTVTNIVARPLAEFDSEDEVNRFVAQLIQMAETATE